MEDSPFGVPRVIPADGDLVIPKLLGTPEVRTLLGYTRRVLKLQDHKTLAVFSYSNAARANWIFLITADQLSSKRIHVPNNDVASHGAALGTDGDIYIMPYATGRAYRYHVEEEYFEDLEIDLPTGEYTWDALGASNGCIYFGTYPNAYLGEYNALTGRCTLWRQVAESSKHVTSFREDEKGRVHFRAWGPCETWLLFDPETRTIESSVVSSPDAPVLPDPPCGDTSFQGLVELTGRRFAVGFPTGRLWELLPGGEVVCRGDSGNPAEQWFLEGAADGVIGISHFGAVFRYDLATGKFRGHQLPNRAPAGNSIMFIESVTPCCAIGANYSQQNLFRVHPSTGEIVNSDQMVARVSGEPMCAVGLGGVAYVGIYIQSIISVFDPSKPFSFGENPRELIELGEKYVQTRPRAAVTDGKHAFISSDSAYNRLGGALAIIDHETEEIDVHYQLIRDQNLPTLAYDPTTGILWGGTDRWGQMRSHPPTQRSSLVYAFNPENRELEDTMVLWPDSDVTSVLGVSAEGVLIASSGQDAAILDTSSREVLYKGSMPVDIPGRVVRGSDGCSYCLSGGALYRWDLLENTLTPVADSLGCNKLTEAYPGTWLLMDGKSIFRCTLPRSEEGD